MPQDGAVQKEKPGYRIPPAAESKEERDKTCEMCPETGGVPGAWAQKISR